MKTIFDWRRLALAATAAIALAGCAAGPPSADADDEGGAYVVDPDGNVYKDADGNCWQTPNAPKKEKRAECGDRIAQTDGDSDGDGVPDSRDKCPGTPRGVEVDARGCPIEKQSPIVLKGVTFEFDSSKLTMSAENRLDNVVDALEASSDVRFRIDGHTDSVGSESYNLGLSQRRVESVREYLTNGGIDTRRITATEGHGESEPVATNETAAGRAQNRRVELSVVSD